jgi:hypothetical protein
VSDGINDIAEVGRALGHDLYRLSRMRASIDWPQSVREGFVEARLRGLTRSRPDRFVAKWLQLRLGAEKRGRPVADGVTPNYLRQIDVAECPVLRTPLTHGALADSDWSVDRLNNDAAYATNNLAVMSTRANRAKGQRPFDVVLALAGGEAIVDGLAPVEWLRLAAMMLGPCFASRPADAPDLPMPIAIPNRTVRTAMQQVQYLLASRCDRHSGKNALVKYLTVAAGAPQATLALRLLAEAVHKSLKGLDYPWDVWMTPENMHLLLAWRAKLDEAAWARVGALSVSLIGGKRFDVGRLLDWRLPTAGYRASGKGPGVAG